MYQGIYITNRFRWVKGKPIERPRGEWIVTPVEAAVDALLWSDAQERMRNGPRARPGGGRETYMLAGKLVDPVNGKGFVGYRSAKATRNYRRKKFIGTDGTVHRTISVSALELDGFVWDQLERALDQPEEFIRLHRGRSRRFSEEASLAEQRKIVAGLADAAARRVDRVERDYYDGRIPAAQRDKLLEEYSAERDASAARLRELQAKIDSVSRLEEGCRDLQIASERFRHGLRNLSYEQKARLCALLVERVEIRDEGDIRLATAYQTSKHSLPSEPPIYLFAVDRVMGERNTKTSPI